MKNHKNHIKCLSKIVAALLLCAFCIVLAPAFHGAVAAVQAADISCDSQGGEIGDLVTFTFTWTNMPNDVNAFMFDIYYDEALLQYVDYTKGALMDNFFMSVNGDSYPGWARLLRL